MNTTTIAAASTLQREGRVTTKDVIKKCLAAIDIHKDLNAFISVSSCALKEADRLDMEARQCGRRSPLHGIPFVVKDNIDVHGFPTTVASSLYRYSAPKIKDAAAIARLRNAGAVFIGKTNMDELAAHVSGMTSAFGPAVNPYQPHGIQYSPGGSSSGTAVAVAAGMCLGGIGTDTGGSIRIPAGWCGLCGLRPTHGLISNFGIFPRAETLDTLGFITKNTSDMKIVFTTFMHLKDNCQKRQCAKDVRIVVPKSIFNIPMDSEILISFQNAVESFRLRNFHVEHKEIPFDLECYEKLTNTLRAFEFANSAGQCVFAEQRNDLHQLVKKDFEYGMQIPTESYLDALRKRREIQYHLETIFGDAEILMTPVTPCRPLPLSSSLDIFKKARTFMDFSSIAGLPSLVINTGLTEEGLPAGIQLIGKPWQEMTLIQAGIAFEYSDSSSHQA